jgi:hypothetical protein
MSMVPAVLVALGDAAHRAAEAEASFRREAAQQVAVLARERSFAYRRLNLAQAVAAAVANAEKEDAAAGLASAVLRHEFGWSGDSDAQTAVFDRFAPVAFAIFRSLSPEAQESGGADVLAALTAFETWYAEAHTGPFWALFDHYVPETSVVDF